MWIIAGVARGSEREQSCHQIRCDRLELVRRVAVNSAISTMRIGDLIAANAQKIRRRTTRCDPADDLDGRLVMIGLRLKSQQAGSKAGRCVDSRSGGRIGQHQLSCVTALHREHQVTLVDDHRRHDPAPVCVEIESTLDHHLADGWGGWLTIEHETGRGHCHWNVTTLRESRDHGCQHRRSADVGCAHHQQTEWLLAHGPSIRRRLAR